jgi:lipoprotein-releasing system ATP-binding protein
MKKKIIEAKHIDKEFHDPVTFKVLKDISFSINEGEFVSVIGRSGSGKSTLLYVLSTMDTDYKGELYLDNELMSNQPHESLARIRNEKIGFVFQFHYLLPEFTVLDNVILPALKKGKLPENEIIEKGMSHLKTLGVDKLAHKKAYKISGGEKQRVSIARALINNPLILMCDEPTGNLDKKNADIVFEIFQQLVQVNKQSILVVTHDHDFAERTDRIIEMDDGAIIKS